jgi:hypothetical protein
MNFTHRDKVTGRAKAITKARLKIRTAVKDVAAARARTKLRSPITAKVLVRSRGKIDRAHRLRTKGG